MDREEANARFAEADELYRIGDFGGALYILDDLDRAFPHQHRLLNARARCLNKLGRLDEALELCDRLIHEFRYPKAADLRQRIVDRQYANAFGDTDTARPRREAAPAPVHKSASSLGCGRIVLFLFIGLALLAGGLLAAGAALGWLGWQTAGIATAILIVVAVLLPVLVGRVLRRTGRKLLETPFRMKAKALHGARAEVHNVSAAVAPADEDEDEKAKGPLAWYWIDVTIIPQERTEGFTNWEPGELALADAARQIRGMDDLDHAHQVHDVQIVENGAIHAWEGEKYRGPMRVKLLVGLPENVARAQFVYYTVAFGEVALQ
ncbi:MAG: tetratricopeptide repeat protein [Candidatus Hydrogenedentales bacterium]